MGDVGLNVVAEILPDLRKQKSIDIVIAQAENLSQGKGILKADYGKLRSCGVDFCTGGNWTLEKSEIYDLLDNPEEPIVRPANYPLGTPGLGAKKIHTADNDKVLVVSLLGSIVGKDSEKPRQNPLKVIDAILQQYEQENVAAVVVNFHGDYSSEKVVIGHYLDGRASLVVGDHWHVPTADAQVLPGGTAHITDVGMTGSLDSSLGVEYEVIIGRWRDGQKRRNVLEQDGRKQFNAILVEVDEVTAQAKSIEPIRRIFD